MLTLAEENYIKCIFKLSQKGTKTVSTNEIAEMLLTKPASVSDMLKKLSKKQLLKYEKYYGVELTNEGIKYATNIIRKHRIWEVFLVEKLNFKWDEVHVVAEQLEHIDSNLLIDRLDVFLNFPKHDPHGGQIPDKDGKWEIDSSFPMSKGKAGSYYKVMRVQGTNELLKHLDDIKIGIGTKLKIIKKREFDDLIEIELDSNRKEMISNTVAQSLLVEKDEN